MCLAILGSRDPASDDYTPLDANSGSQITYRAIRTTGQLFLNDNPDSKRSLLLECERCQFFAFFAFLFSLRLRCEEPRQTDKFPVMKLVNDPSALRSFCRHGESYIAWLPTVT